MNNDVLWRIIPVLSVCIVIVYSNGFASEVTTCPSIVAVRAERVSVDGVLDEQCWKLAQPVTDFVQWDPCAGAEPSNATEARAAFDDYHLFLGFRCHMPRGHRPVISIKGQDKELWLDDMVEVYLDPYGDGKTVYYFAANPIGSRLDGMSTGEGGEISDEWDGAWHYAAAVDDSGWTAEFSIPFEILPIGSDAPSLAVDFQRVDKAAPSGSEEVHWPNASGRRFQGSQFARIEGISGVLLGRRVELTPYATSTNLPERAEERWQNEVGIDLLTDITPSIALNLTINPDFGDIEADADHFVLAPGDEMFYPEKRRFFMEGRTLFTSPMNIFYSRRLGKVLSDGSEVGILGGAKIAGKVGQLHVGLLDVWTEGRRDTLTGMYEPETNYFVGRVISEHFERGSIGFLGTFHRQVDAESTTTNLTHIASCDGHLSLSETSMIRWLVAYGTNPDASIRGSTTYLSVGREVSRGLCYDLTFRNRDEEFVPLAGLAQRAGDYGITLWTEYRVEPNRLSVRNASFMNFLRIWNNSRGRSEEQCKPECWVRLRKEIEFSIQPYTWWRRVYDFDRHYDFRMVWHSLWVGLNTSSWTGAEAYLETGEEFGYLTRFGSFTAKANPIDVLAVQLELQNKILQAKSNPSPEEVSFSKYMYGPYQSRTEWINAVRIRWQPTPDLFVKSYYQFGDVYQDAFFRLKGLWEPGETDLNFLFGWTFRPSSVLYMGYNDDHRGKMWLAKVGYMIPLRAWI